MRASVIVLAGFAWLGGSAALADVTTPGKAPTPAPAPDAAPPVVDEHACDPNGKRVDAIDINGDGKPDVWKLYAPNDPAHLLCKRVDLNFDGKTDYFVIYDAAGDVVLEMFDLDFDSFIDKKVWKRGGKIVLDELDTDGDGKPDLRTWYRDGKPWRTERIPPPR
jgi:hypothetical protein